VGFNPFRPQTRRRSDIVFVIAGVAIALALVVWAAYPR